MPAVSAAAMVQPMHHATHTVAEFQKGNPGLVTALVQSSPDCVKFLDASGCVEFFNANGLCLMEIDDFSAVRGTYWAAALWPIESRPLVEKALAEARASGAGAFAAACPTAKGTPKWWDVV